MPRHFRAPHEIRRLKNWHYNLEQPVGAWSIHVEEAIAAICRYFIAVIFSSFGIFDCGFELIFHCEETVQIS